MIFRDLIDNTTRVATANAPALLTAFGVVGTVTTSILAGKASFEAYEKIALEREEQLDALATREERDAYEMSKTDKIKLVYPLYIPAVVTGTMTVSAIILAHRVSSKRAAVIAAAYALNEGKLEEYQTKVKEKLGIKDEQTVRDEIAQDHINEEYEDGEVIFSPLDGKVLIRDDYSGRFFWSSIEEINKAVNEINMEIITADYETLSNFYRAIGLTPVSTSDYVGWNTRNRLELSWSTCTTPDGKTPVHSFEFVNPPVLEPGANASF